MNFRMVIGTLSLGAMMALGTHEARASSHREAPFITKNPKVDGTDFYMFNSYESGRTGFVTLIANYLPLQDSYGGPNYFSLDPDALYEISIDNNGDAKEDVTFQFRFSNALNDSTGATGITLPIGPSGSTKNMSIPVLAANAPGANLGSSPITATNEDSFVNVKETYTVNVVRGDRRTGTSYAVNLAGSASSTTFRKPLDFVGTKTMGSDAAYERAQQHLGERHALQERDDDRARGARCVPDAGLRDGRWRLVDGERPPGAGHQPERDVPEALARGRCVGAGIASRQPARERGRHRAEGQGQFQLELPLG
jgi:hypothetical protein